MKTRSLKYICLALLLIIIAAQAPGCTVSPGPNQVIIKNLAFVPDNLVVNKGTKVTWVNEDNTVHTVTSDENKFKSQPLNPGDTFSFTFGASGRFPYHCDIHPFLKGSVTVR